MADMDRFATNPQAQLLDEIKDARCVMLGTPDPDLHMQPMAPQIDVERVGDVIYFYSDTSSELGQSVRANPGSSVMLCHIGKDYQACVKGTIVEDTRADLIEHFWNPIAASWYPGGQDDPKMMMVRFVPQDAGVWASTGNPVKFLYETVKANVTDTVPDVGGHKEIDL